MKTKTHGQKLAAHLKGLGVKLTNGLNWNEFATRIDWLVGEGR